MSEIQFCKKCGSKLITQNLPAFDEDTGERLTEKVCPVDACGHTGRTHKYKWHLFSAYSECVRCGYIPPEFF